MNINIKLRKKMTSFEADNFGSILNSENIKDEEVDNLNFGEDLFDIEEDYDEEKDGSESDADNDEESGAESEELPDGDFLNNDNDDEPSRKDRSYKERSKESEKLEDILGDNKTTDGKFENIKLKIANNYDRIRNITSKKELPEMFPSLDKIKTVRHAEEVLRLTNKKLDSMMVNDALVEIVPIVGDVLAFFFNGERVILGKKPDLTGYSLKLRNKLSYCNNDIGTIADSMVQSSVLSSIVKVFSIFGLPLYGTLKENSDRSKQGLKKEKLIELNNKASKGL